ncbi:MAG: hypothetical protein ACYTXT_43590 [Nostoc sp.]
MRLVTKNTQFVVFDDFLSSQDFELVQKYVRDENYRSYDANKLHNTHRLFDGKPLIGESSVVSQKLQGIDDKVYKLYPTTTGIDIFIEHLLSKSEALTEWIGKKDIEWESFTAKVFLYPQGTALSWHDDGGSKTGSYAFYTHSSWNIQWGGDLLIPDESTKNNDYPLVKVIDSDSDSDSEYDNKKNIDIGIGQYIAPKPNRLVVIAGGNPHRINKIEFAAGDNLRCSISGFFVRCNHS